MKGDHSDPVKIAVLGSGVTGKGTLVYQYIWNKFLETSDPDLENVYRKDVEFKGERIAVEVLDTPGQEEFEQLRNQWIQWCDGFIMTYYINDRRKLKELIELDLVGKSFRVKGTIPILMLGVMKDLEDEREVTQIEAEALANRLGVGFMEASSKTRENVEEAFNFLIERILKMHRNP
eukprot:TRINITY_DN6416_c0_g1_i2.p1 TRINITY_DN6416_c0_g1~~TRINITY_DN6416_c0_g1_i2.p1  ORF type:complete len:177 (-),score=52.17 TRINITY_DN6416_c0_g1_i2:114-644(-)